MKVTGLVLAILLSGATPTFTNLVTVSPEVSISSASAQVACQGWWDENCCRWFRPELCATISPQLKDHAKVWSYGLSSGMSYLQPVIYLYTAHCVGAGDYESCANALILAATRKGLEIGKHWADKFVQDPWDENYGYGYEPQFYDPVSQLGLPDCAQDGSWKRDFCAWNNAQGQHIFAFGEAAYVSANRSASCGAVGNADCFLWQRDRMEYFLWAMGVHIGYVGDGLSILTNILGSQDVSNAAAEVHYVSQLMVAQ